MDFIDNILIKQIGLKTSTHDRCIYMKVIDYEVVYILRQIDDCLCQLKWEETAKNIFNIIGNKMSYPSEEKKDIVLFEFLGVLKDYNCVDIKQTSYYIDMSCESYIKWLWKSRDWETTISTLNIDVEQSCLQTKSNRLEHTWVLLRYATQLFVLNLRNLYVITCIYTKKITKN